MASEAGAGARPRRLHPTTLAFTFIGLIKVLIVPGLLVFWRTREGGWEVWLMALFIPGLAFSIFRYFTYRYWFETDELIVRQGLIFRSERHIPYRRIQNINLVQNLLHRLVGVAEVRIETASGTEPEATMKVLSLAAVETVRDRVFAGRQGVEPVEGAAPELDEGHVVLRLPTIELAKLGLIANRGIAVVLILAGLAWEFDLFEESALGGWFEGQWAAVRSGGWVWIGPVIFLGVLLLITFSIVWTIFRLHDFTLRRVGDDLRLSCGLLTKRSATVPRHRVQFISIHESVPHRWFDRVTIRIETAGGGTGGDGDEEKVFTQRWLLPLVPNGEVPRVLREIAPGFPLTEASWQSLAPRARGRMMRKSVILGLLLTVPFALFFRPWGALAGLVLVPFSLWYAAAEYRRYGWARVENGLVFRSGVLNRKVSGTLFEKMQTVTRRQNPFDRRYDMAKVAVDTAGAGPAGHKIHIPYLTRETADDLAGDLARRAGGVDFRWS